MHGIVNALQGYQYLISARPNGMISLGWGCAAYSIEDPSLIFFRWKYM